MTWGDVTANLLIRMAKASFRHVTIVGVGLIGGSCGLAIKKLDSSVRIAGVGRRRASLDAALNAKAIDTAHLDATEVAGQTDLVILSTPVCAFEKHLRSIGPLLKKTAIVTDVGSTKSVVVRAASRALGRTGRFVGSHPMAGSESKGVAHANADLLKGAVCIVTPTGATPQAVTRRVERLWKDLGMKTLRLSPADHDRAVAKVSHLPHALAALMMTVCARSDMSVAATGFRDVTRLASGDAEMWRDIFTTNRKAILAAIDDFDEALMQLRDMLSLTDAPGIEKFLKAAKKRRDAMVE